MRASTLAAASLLLAAGLTACSGDSGDSTPEAVTPAPEPTDTGTVEPDDSAEDGVTEDGDPAPTEAVFGFEAIEAQPGTWAVGEAGTVSFEIQDGALVLGEVVANDGWRITDTDEEPDEIEVDFEQGPVEIEIEIELSSLGVLEIEIDTDIDPADPGTYQVGDAGEITWSLAGGALTLDDLSIGNDWQVTDRDEEPDEIEIELRRGAAEWDIEIELDDGVPEVELDFEVTSQV